MVTFNLMCHISHVPCQCPLSAVSCHLTPLTQLPALYSPDLGCNLGMYSLMVAAMGGRVVAVDGMEDNLAYIWYSRLQPAIY